MHTYTTHTHTQTHTSHGEKKKRIDVEEKKHFNCPAEDVGKKAGGLGWKVEI